MPESTSTPLYTEPVITYTGTGQTKPGDIISGTTEETPIVGTLVAPTPVAPTPAQPTATPTQTSNQAQAEATQLQTDIQKAVEAPSIVSQPGTSILRFAKSSKTGIFLFFSRTVNESPSFTAIVILIESFVND